MTTYQTRKITSTKLVGKHSTVLTISLNAFSTYYDNEGI